MQFFVVPTLEDVVDGLGDAAREQPRAGDLGAVEALGAHGLLLGIHVFAVGIL